MSSAFVALMLGLAPADTQAAWPSNPSVNVPICTSPNNQYSPAIASDGAGGAIIAWYDFRNGTNYNIYAQRVNAAGVPQWTHDGEPICTAPRDKYDPVIVADGAGGAIIAWIDFRNGTNYDIYAQRVDARGKPQWTLGGVPLCTAANDRASPRIVSDGSGGAIVTWYDLRNGVGNADIYAQRVNAGGEPQWANDGVAVCTAAADEFNPAIASDGSGGAIVTWNDYRSGINFDIYAQRLNAVGVPQWAADGVPLCTANEMQFRPAIVADGSGGAIVAWEDYRNGATSGIFGPFSDIYAQRVNAAGVPQWPIDGVSVCTTSYNKGVTTITSDCTGGAIIAWTGQVPNVYAQRIGATGAPQWSSCGVSLSTTGVAPSIGPDGAGGAIVTWEDSRNGGTDIYAQRVSAAGISQWKEGGLAISTATNNQEGPSLLSDGAGGAMVAWWDSRDGTDTDIYVQNINADGTLGWGHRARRGSPSAFGLAFSAVNQRAGGLDVSFSLADASPATLELYDMSGRRIGSRSLGALGPGSHVVTFVIAHRLAPGVYGVRLLQAWHSAFAKVAILR